MLELPRWRVVLCLAAAIFGLLFTVPNVLPANVLARMPDWLPHQKLNLGLDLQGGSYLQLELDTNALKTERLNNLVEDVRRTLRDLPVDFSSLGIVGDAVSVRINDPGQVQNALTAIQKLNSQVAPGVSELSIATAPDQRILITVTDQALKTETVKAVDQDIEIVRKRIDALGTKEPSIVRQGADRIVVEAPGESDPQKLKDVIGKTAKLSFQMVDDSVPLAEAAAGHVPPDSELLPNDEGGVLLVKRLEIVSGSMLTGATQGNDQDGRPDINMRFNGQGAQRFGDATSQNIGKRFAIVLDNRVISAPVIQGAITGGSGEITGNFTIDSATNLALLLRSGALAAPLTVIEQRTVGAELGADSVRAGELAGVIGLGLVAAFMLLAYGGVFGGVAVVGLIVNMLMVVAFMTVGGAALTLPGIAGLILTIAVAVDANVLIYERIRDEERGGRKPARAIDTGFVRARTSILDANITTLIAALILFEFGAGPVRGFAWTLSIGVLTSVFTALFITRLLVVLWYNTSRSKQLPI
ncbi:MAG TPA: protein translocase subunit SecD [Caulobacteraceae bacterium]|jgi:preprotein translocase subunit SecD|nr:protein translocase subunit SecD [Caulobacteraceae bacterium]